MREVKVNKTGRDDGNKRGRQMRRDERETD